LSLTHPITLPQIPPPLLFFPPTRKNRCTSIDPDAYMQRIYFWQDVPRRAKYNEIWNEVKAAQ